jgi:hypothetical protein
VSDTNKNRVRCRAVRRDGSPCQGPATSSGYCIAHDERASQWRVLGGRASRRSERAMKLLPERLDFVVNLLGQSLDELYHGRMTVKLGMAMAQLAGVLTRIIQGADLSERVHDLEREVERLRATRHGLPQAAEDLDTRQEQPRWSA